MMLSNGHINVLIRDHESIITHYGKHDRVVAFLPNYDSDFNCVVLYVRVDHKWGLGEPTIAEILDVARKDQGVKGKFVVIKSDKHDDNKSTDYYFKKG